ncbi:MAG: caspase family protein [Gracilimonas sp.]|nr:caspase family protein [Gracilimonas sp.]
MGLIRSNFKNDLNFSALGDRLLGRSTTALFLVVTLFFSVSCSSTSWVVIEEDATDVSDYELTESEFFLDPNDTITPQAPFLNVDLMAVNTYEYAQRIRTERYIQRYRPRLGYVMLGVAGAGLSYYAAFSDQLLQQPTDPQRYSLIGAGTLLTGLSFLNMKPVDEPTKTGETRLLRKTGTIMVADTIETLPYTEEQVKVSISYGDSLLINSKNYGFNDNNISINLAEEINSNSFGEDPQYEIKISVEYDTLRTVKSTPIASIFEQFVVVDTEVTPLRNAPDVNSDNVLTDLAEGSQLKLVKREGKWFKVLYGISETWISTSDVYTIWRPAEFSSDLTVVTIPNIPFGSIDVERDIPELGDLSQNTAALIISNDQYSGQFSERTYGDRDSQLLEEYFTQGLGIRSNNFIRSFNIDSTEQMNAAADRLLNLIDRNRNRAIVYINGYALVEDGNLYMVGTNYNGEKPMLINLKTFFDQISQSQLSEFIGFVDLDIIQTDDSDLDYQTIVSDLTDSISRSAVIFSSNSTQRSGIYSSQNGERNRHSIFSYYLAEALKQNKKGIDQILDHLQRNVPFRSRSIYDRPQDPVLIGRSDIQLVE